MIPCLRIPKIRDHAAKNIIVDFCGLDQMRRILNICLDLSSGQIFAIGFNAWQQYFQRILDDMMIEEEGRFIVCLDVIDAVYAYPHNIVKMHRLNFPVIPSAEVKSEPISLRV